MRGCDNRATISRKVRLLEEISDYYIEMKLCPRHKNHFRSGEALIGINLKNYGKETLLGQGKDIERKRMVDESLDYLRKRAESMGYGSSMEILIKAAQHFAKAGDAKFLFGYYFGQLFGLVAFKDIVGVDVKRRQRAEQIRKNMSLRQLYGHRERPDTSNEPIDVCRCGHEWFLHKSGQPAECVSCLCPNYAFEQRLTRAEIGDLQSLMYREQSGSKP